MSMLRAVYSPKTLAVINLDMGNARIVDPSHQLLVLNSQIALIVQRCSQG